MKILVTGIAGFIGYRLTGRACADISLACRSLLYDVENRCWSKEMCEICSVKEEQLAAILEAGRWAPTAFNRQPQRVFILESEEAVADLQAFVER